MVTRSLGLQRDTPTLVTVTHVAGHAGMQACRPFLATCSKKFTKVNKADKRSIPRVCFVHDLSS